VSGGAARLDLRTHEVYTCAFSADGARALVGAESSPVAIWDTRTGRRLQVLDDTSLGAWALRWSVDERHALVAGQDAVVRLWNLEEGRWIRALEGEHRGMVRCVDMSADMSLALSAGFRDDTGIRLWDVQGEECVRVLEGHRDGVYAVALDSRARHALSGSRDGTIRLWDLDSGRCLRVLEGHTYHVHCVAWSADESHALSCSREIRLWSLRDGRCLRVFGGHTDTIRTVVWSGDQRRFLSAAHDGTVRLWDAETGSSTALLARTVGMVGADFVESERRVVSCDWEGGIHFHAFGAGAP
jgi:WD40 repeat protein